MTTSEAQKEYLSFWSEASQAVFTEEMPDSLRIPLAEMEQNKMLGAICF